MRRNLTASYTYNNYDQLTRLQTASTAYDFSYDSFGLRANIQIGTRTLASYTYDEQDHTLTRLDYGNRNRVEYTYDELGRVTNQTYEDGDTITFLYDNNGALATVKDHATGVSTTYYYDEINRLIRYVETDNSSYDHSVTYGYDELNYLTLLTEIIDGVTRTTSYTYDNDNRISTITSGSTSLVYSYDDSGRAIGINLKVSGNSLLNRSFAYQANANNSTALISALTNTAANFGLSFSYTYDDNGNITSVSDGTNTTTYEYDSANQLIR